jgi:hypothetical protein
MPACSAGQDDCGYRLNCRGRFVPLCREKLVPRQGVRAMKRETHPMRVLERFSADAPALETDDPVANVARRLGSQAGRVLLY